MNACIRRNPYYGEPDARAVWENAINIEKAKGQTKTTGATSTAKIEADVRTR